MLLVALACRDSVQEPHPPSAKAASARRSVGPLQEACNTLYPAQAASSRYGIGTNRWGYWPNAYPADVISPASYERVATLYRQANVGWVRVDFDWGQMIGTGPDTNNLDFSALDATVRNACRRGVNILGNISYTPAWAVQRTVAYPGERYRYLPDNLGHWEAAVRRIVNRYPQIRYWSIWNEPNSTGYFRGWDDGQTRSLVDDYNTLLGAAAPHIVGNVDAQGRRYLVALELAGGSTAADDAPWVRGVLNGPAAGFIDVVAYHKYGGVNDIKNRATNLASENSGAINGGWRWPIWLTEAGPTGCLGSAYQSRTQYGYCYGDSSVYMRDDSLVAHVQGVLGGMQAAPAGARWDKTFPWHSHLEPVFDAAAQKWGGDDRGLLVGAVANQPRGRPAFTAYAGIAGPLQVSGPTLSGAGPVTLTALPGVPSPAAPYYFVWDYRWCSQGGGPDDCTYEWYRYDEGLDLRSVDTYVGPGDYNLQFRVRQSSDDQQTHFGTRWHIITGPGDCRDGGCTELPGANAGAASATRAAASGVRALRMSASAATIAGAPPDSTAPVTGRPATSGDPTSLSYQRTYGAAGVRRWLQQRLAPRPSRPTSPEAQP